MGAAVEDLGMRDGGDVVVLRGGDVIELLRGREVELMQLVRRAYEAHAAGASSLPHSIFLRFPHDARSRIIALPAYLGGEFDVAGMKWVSSFPSNRDLRINRASAVVVLNSARTGRPALIAEGSVISAKRTAASAALAASHLCAAREPERVGLIGCGAINYEVARFLLAAFPEGAGELDIFDTDVRHAERFREKCLALRPGLRVNVRSEVSEVLKGSALISFATTALAPHVFDLSACAPGSVVLHVSLRDLSPEVILACENVVDDVDHVCRAQTSIHLAEQLAGNRDFIRCTLADVTAGTAPAREDPNAVAVFSPFGLGILDLAVAQLVYRLAADEGRGTVLEDFSPDSWAESW
ncbi:MAG TPA: 2,3-diaminopropionate biosynthesis protein SbnB [Pyrinomonadaceae bacterium]|jgi:ornithine cyclodeaminase